MLGTGVLAACGAGAAATGSASSAGAATASAAAATSAAPAASAGSAAAASVAASTAAAATTSAQSSASAPASSAAAANGPKPTPTPASGQSRPSASTTVTLWYGWGGQTAIHTWETLEPKMAETLTNFNVQWVVANNNAKLLAAIAGGSPPTVAVGNAPYLEIWSKSAATQLDDYIAKSKVVVRSDIPDAYWKGAGYKGKIFGVPAVEGFVFESLCFNINNVQKAGIDPKTVSWDWDTLTQLQQQLTTKQGTNIAVLGIHPLDAMGSSLGTWAFAWDVQYLDDSTNTYNLANDQLAEALATIKKLYDIAGGPSAVSAFQKSYGTWTQDSKAMLPSGVEDMNINGYWAAGELAHSSPSNQFYFTWAPVPSARKGFKLQAAGTHYAFIPNGAKHANEGFQLIEFLVGDVGAPVIFESTGWLNSRRSLLDKIDANKYPGLSFFVNSAKQNDKLYGSPNDLIGSFTSDQWSKAIQAVVANEKTPKDALQQVQQLVTQEFKMRYPNG